MSGMLASGVLAFALTGATFAQSDRSDTGTGTGATTSSSTTRSGTGTGTGSGMSTANSMNSDRDNSSGFNPGWFGLAGLIGLLGLMPRDSGDHRHRGTMGSGTGTSSTTGVTH